MKNKLNILNQTMRNSSAYLLLLLFLLTSFAAKAGEEIYFDKLYGSDITFPQSINVNATNTSTDIRYQEAQNYVLLQINPDITAPDYTAKVDLSISYTNAVGANTIINKILQVEHNTNPGVVHNDRDAYLFTEGYNVSVKVNSINFINGPAPISYDNLELVNHITVNRLYELSCLDVPSITSMNPIADTRELEIEWSPVPCAEEYQLEWLHINNYDATCSDLNFNFRNNSTRISTKENTYRISMVFEQGFVLFRVRSLTYDEENQDIRIPSEWSAPSTQASVCSHTDRFEIQPANIHESDKLNWQYSTSYAEEGKKKEVVTYFDGSLRSHQVVTRINTDNQAIVGETFYDHQGRAAIQALPAPVHEGEDKVAKIEFYPNFNKAFTSGDGYNRSDFDIDVAIPGSPNACNISADEMSPISGASKYYSPNNPEADEGGHQAYVPDAQNYPFTHVEYEPDNTGRVRRQSGVGPTHQLGSGHDTKYFYGKPAQEELNRLFASEVGYNQHYKKNMVIDPNGQVSVSYMDQQGRTIATALAGQTPDNLRPLSSNQEDGVPMMTIDILDNQPVQPGVEPIVSTYHHLVTTMGDHTFNYALNCVELVNNGVLNADICLNCVYDLVIDVVGECGNSFGGATAEAISIEDLCDPDTPHTETFIIESLPVGKYVITRTLQMNQEALQENTEACLESEGVLDLDDFLDAAMAEIDESQCEQPDCNTECEGLSEADRNQCMLDCEFGDPCETKTNVLIGDFVPTNVENVGFDIGGEIIPTTAGQYALFGTDPNDCSDFPYSILNTTSSNELGIDYTNPDLNYVYEEDGVQTPIQVYNTAGELVFPYQLTPQEFIDAYEPHWGNAFIDYHPEACHIGLCQDMIESQRYDFLMMTTESYAEAFQLGLLNPVPTANSSYNFPAAVNSPYDEDPFFAAGGEGAGLAGAMQGFLNNYPVVNVDVWQLAAAAITGIQNPNYTFTPIENTDACTRDRVWQLFRGLYLAEKMRLYQDALDAQEADCDPLGDKISHFPEYEVVMEEIIDAAAGVDTPAEMEDLTQVAEDAIWEQCQIRSNALANIWMETLEGCADDPANWIAGNSIYDRIRAGLIEVMEYSCGAEYPFGASTLPDGETTGTPYNYTSFESVLATHLNAADITLTCSADLITFPGAYGHEYASYTPYQVIDQCACDAILETNAQFATDGTNGTLPTGVTTAEELFEYNYEIEISGYDAKVCLCNRAIAEGKTGGVWSSDYNWENANTEILTNSGEYIFADIACQNCGGCEEISDAADEYINNSLGDTNYNDLTGEERDNLHTMVANHLNNTFNLDLTYPEYADFYENCTILEEGVPVCETLTTQGAAFAATLNVIASQGTIADINCLCLDPYIDEYGPVLAEVLNLDYSDSQYCHDIYTPQSMTPTSMNIQVQSVDDRICDWTISFVYPDPNTNAIAGYNLDNISSLQNIRPNDADPTNTQQFLADVQVNVNNVLVDATILVTSDCYEIWECISSLDEMELCNHLFILEIEDDCLQNLIDAATNQAENLYNDYVDDLTDDIENNYIEQCTPSDNEETFTMEYPDNEYHYTLYYYNQSGNLTRTVPPAGIQLVPQGLWTAVDADRENDTQVVSTAHRMSTRYKYNSLNQLTHQTMPDHDNMAGEEWSTRFFYDDLGRIVASQNSKQAKFDIPRYSYTKYDALGRIAEAGELISSTEPTDAILEDINAYPDNWSTNRVQVVKTFYDRTFDNTIAAQFYGGQENLRNRVASIVYEENYTSNTSEYQSASHFSYDIHGNVKTLIQENTELAHLDQQFKVMTYEYDLISGNVHQVNYQKGEPDQFFHSYEYDGDNRITKVMTSPDGVIWDEDARYQYYQHGPLARTEIGDLRVQGCDFAYTIQGWIKGVNSNTLLPYRDIGKDGTGPVEERYAPDVYGYGLHYYDDDYKAIDDNITGVYDFMADVGDSSGVPSAPSFKDASKDLFNGNISKMVTAISPVNGEAAIPIQGNAYKYDQLNRILSSNSYRGGNYVTSQNAFSSATDNEDYKTAYTYDANGNILSLLRNGHSNNGQAQAMDELSYNYETDRNRLLHVDDNTNLTNNYTDDIDDQAPNNYEYDATGNLTKDEAEDIKEIVWRVDGKVERVIRKLGSDKPDLLFRYDPSGNRITKAVFHKNPTPGNPEVTYTHYVRDASGNTMAVYKREQKIKQAGEVIDHLRLSEQHLYGSSRLGVRNADNTLNNSAFVNLGLNLFGEYELGNLESTEYIDWLPEHTHRPLGAKNYELSNHLGNVLATVSDRKLSDGASYVADVKSASDYYPFGMAIGDRTMVSEGYRYGFNRMEKDGEINGNSGDHLDFGARIYSTRLGRWWSIDNVVKADLSSYQFGRSNPIVFVDPDGNDEYYFNSDGTWSVTRAKGPDVFHQQDVETGCYRAMNARLPRELSEKTMQNLEDLAFIAEYAIDNRDFKKDINSNQGEGETLAAQNELAAFCWTYALVSAWDQATDILSGGTKKVAKDKSLGLAKKAYNYIKKRKKITIDGKKYPESAKHAQEAIDKGIPNTGTIDRAGKNKRRRDNLKGVATEKGKDRDEFPPAMVKPDGKASVKKISPSDNRGAGSSMGHQARGLPDGTEVEIVPVNVPD